ncbi:MAG: ABC transporter ATP-binding protein [Nitrospirota bacterium]
MNKQGNAISISGVSKLYNIYDSPRDRLKELLPFTRKKYCKDFWALDGVSFDVAHGETLGFIGRNGSGKSTLLQIICGILKPTSGTAATEGRISALLELGTGFNQEFTGRENVYLNGALMGFTKEEMDARYDDIAGFADIGDFINQPVKMYSSGMYVRLAFACAVNVDPDILIVDEALSVGDVFFQQKCFRKMAEFKERGKTMLFVSHDLEAVRKNCDRAIFLDKGKLIKIGESRDVINNYLETVLLGDKAPAKAGVADGAAPAAKSKTPPPADDRCKFKRGYNKNEFRYGNYKAAIIDFSILDKDGGEVTAVSSGEVICFRFEVAFKDHVEFPIYGFIVKTKDGLTVYGLNTWHGGVPVSPKAPGESVTVEFSLGMDVGAGDYFLSAGVAELAGEDVNPVDRRYDLAYLNVMPVDKSFGVANLFSRVNIKNALMSEK